MNGYARMLMKNYARKLERIKQICEGRVANETLCAIYSICEEHDEENVPEVNLTPEEEEDLKEQAQRVMKEFNKRFSLNKKFNPANIGTTKEVKDFVGLRPNPVVPTGEPIVGESMYFITARDTNNIDHQYGTFIERRFAEQVVIELCKNQNYTDIKIREEISGPLKCSNNPSMSLNVTAIRATQTKGLEEASKKAIEAIVNRDKFEEPRLLAVVGEMWLRSTGQYPPDDCRIEDEPNQDVEI